MNHFHPILVEEEIMSNNLRVIILELLSWNRNQSIFIERLKFELRLFLVP